jgi:hypothetical protein
VGGERYGIKLFFPLQVATHQWEVIQWVIALSVSFSFYFPGEISYFEENHLGKKKILLFF